MIDFSKLSCESTEEREQRRATEDRRRLEESLSERAAAATDFRRLVLLDDPEFRYFPSGEVRAVLRYEKDGKPEVAIARQIEGEDDREFVRRFDTLSKGDEVVSHGHIEKRRWKTQTGNWRSTDEFQIDVPLSPESLRPSLPEGVSFPPTAFSLKQQQSGRFAGMSR